MTKSDPALPALDLARAKALLLPAEGSEWAIVYFDGEEEVPYNPERGHTSVSAVSPALRLTVVGGDSYVARARQDKPFVRAGHYRTMLVVRHGDTWVHILGDRIVVAGQRLTVGQIAPGLLEADFRAGERPAPA